jgi:D-glycero-alpha-D-manno-heptose-7-phosphate kinase
MATRQLISRAPTRIDFVGGWTDVQPFCDQEPGVVVNAAFGLYAQVVVRDERADAAARDAFVRAACARFGLGNISIALKSEAPLGAGLGGSGTVGVALVGALAAHSDRSLTRADIAELAHRIEVEDLQVIGGKQDQYAAAYGGFLAMTFEGDHVRVEQLKLAEQRVAELEERSVVVYTGQSRVSGDIHARVQEAYRQRAPATLDALATIRRVSRQFCMELQTGSLDTLGELLNENWDAQKRLHPSTTNREIEQLFRIAFQNGARGGKALGAGGGGCLYFIAREGASGRVQDALRSAGAQVLSTHFDLSGLRVETALV